MTAYVVGPHLHATTSGSGMMDGVIVFEEAICDG